MEMKVVRICMYDTNTNRKLHSDIVKVLWTVQYKDHIGNYFRYIIISFRRWKVFGLGYFKTMIFYTV